MNIKNGIKFTHTETGLPIESEYPKLVRDKIPEIIEKKLGQRPKTIAVNDGDFLIFLLKKAVEEAYELKNSENSGHAIEELADLMEVMEEVLAFYKTDLKTLRSVQKEKRKERGGFKKRLVVMERIGEVGAIKK